MNRREFLTFLRDGAILATVAATVGFEEEKEPKLQWEDVQREPNWGESPLKPIVNFYLHDYQPLNCDPQTRFVDASGNVIDTRPILWNNPNADPVKDLERAAAYMLEHWGTNGNS